MNRRRFLVVSDLHMTSGKDARTGTWSPTEDFFWDEAFRDFLGHYTKGYTLIINGDLLDFLKVLVLPTHEEMEAYGIHHADISRSYGLRCTEASCTFQVDKIIDGHPVFFQALVDFLLAGNEAVILKGNHDVQLFWDQVQERILERLSMLAPARQRSIVRRRLQFLPWCYYVPGLLYVEHGNQYEYTTSFRHFLNPQLPIDFPGTSKQIELDLSGFLVRYIVNSLKPIDPLTDSIRPQSQYLELFWKAHPFVFITTIGTTLRFLLKAFAKAQELKRGSKGTAFEKIAEENRSMIGKEAKRFAGGKSAALEQALVEFDRRKAEPVLTAGPWKFLWMEIKTPLKALLWLLPLYAVTFIPDLSAAAERATSGWGSSFWRSAVLWLIRLRVPQILIVVLLGGLLIWLKQRIRRKRAHGRPEPSDIALKIREDARFIASTLDVKYVTFGHTHYADIFRCSEKSWYFNTGTWMTIFSLQEEMYREPHQFTFLHVEGEEANLLHWNPDRRAPEPVRVVDTKQVTTGTEDSFVKILLGILGLG